MSTARPPLEPAMLGTEDFLPLPVPEALTATYLVPVAQGRDVPDPSDALAALGDRLSRPVRHLVRQMLDGPLLTVDTRAAADFPRLPPDLLSAFGATEAQLARLAGAGRLVLVRATGQAGWPPTHEWAGRAVAAALAEAVDAELVDLFGLQFLDPATAVRSLPDGEGRIRLVDWILVPYSSAEDGLWFTTKGLRRFGMLELQTRGVPAHLTRAWGAVLTGAARRLLRLWSDDLARTEFPAFAQLPVLATVTGHDIATAYGRPERHDATGPALLRLELDPATDPEADSFLSLVPPSGSPGSEGGYFASVCATLFGTTGPDVRYVRRDDAMARAIATARAGLPAVRDRFLAGDLPDGAQLVVKYGLPAGDGPEFVWARVTSWRTRDRIVGVSASDALTEPAVRVGREVEVAEADVVDWALLAGGAVVEGGWTQAVLDSGERT